MGYPSVNFQPTSPIIGLQPIGQSSTTQMHPLGTIIRANDVTYGEAEFVYLLGVASTAKGDLVCYRSDTGVTVRSVHGGTTSVGPCAVAMSANVASQYGWYAIAGSVPANSGSVAANSAGYLTSTAGQIDDTVVSGDEIDGLLIKAADSGGFCTVQLSHPNISGSGGSTGTNTGDVTLAAVGSSPSANGASLSGQVLTLQPADATHPGLVTAGTQTIAGAKTFSTAITASLGVTSAADIVPSADEGANLGSTTRRWGYLFGDGLKDDSGTIRVGTPGSSGNNYNGKVSDGASAIAHKFDNASLSTAGAKLVDVRNNGASKASISKDGVYGAGYTDSSGTPGAATANTPSGRNAIANGASSCVITNSCCKSDSTSIVMVQLESAGVGVGELIVTPGNGQFTVTSVNALGVATNVTGAATFSWIVLNGA